MRWLQPQPDGHISLNSLQLDIVGFLAILGEGSVLANAQVSTLSKWIFLPRLIPAPQALMRPTRPMVLEPVPGHVTGIFSGNYRDSINHIGNIVWYVISSSPHVEGCKPRRLIFILYRQKLISTATLITSPLSPSALSKSNEQANNRSNPKQLHP